MPRKPRFFLPKVPAHIIQRGHSREPVFFEQDDYAAYLKWLDEAAVRYGCALHAYTLMTNHVHLLVTPTEKESVSRMMQYVGRRYVPYINHTYGTSGSIWEGRFKASLIQDDKYLLTCMRYIELNPVRANMTKNPSQYRWSSYRTNAQGSIDDRITPHAIYKQLGKSHSEQCDAYKSLFKTQIDAEELKEIRSACQTGTPLGNDNFKEKIEKKLNTKVGQNRRGRPQGPIKGL